VVPFGIDVGRFKLTGEVERQCEALRKRFGERVVLFVGRLHEQKGLEYLLRAMVGLDARLVLVGTGYLERSLRSLAAELRLGDNVVFEGQLPPNEIVPYLYASSLLVLPSVNSGESFGIVQLEAMICGKPVVSTDLPTGVPWVNQNGITGLIVPPKDVDSLRQAMRRLLLDPQLRCQLGEAGRQRVVSEFTHELHIQRILGLYHELLQQTGK
jgi:rhamnosyl/mannosyltransferase